MDTAKQIYAIVGADIAGFQRAMAQMQASMRKSVGEVNSGVNKIKGLFEGLKARLGSIFVTIGGFELVKKGIEVNADIEQAHIAFTTLLHDTQKANEMINELRHLAVISPFDFDGLQTGAKLLLAMGIDAKNVIPYMYKIGDAVAAVGGNQETLERVARAIAQINAKGKLSAEEMNQLAENGIPAWQILSDKMHKSVDELMKMDKKGELLAKDVIPALIEGMGDRFGGAMQRASKTFSGMLATIKDDADIVLGKLFEPLFNGLKKVMPKIIDLLTQLVDNMNQHGVLRGIHDTILNNFVPKKYQGVVQTFTTGFIGALKFNIQTHDWSGVGAIIGLKLKEAIDGIQGLRDKIAKKIISEIQKIDWKKVFHNAWDLTTGFIGMFNPDLGRHLKKGNWRSAGADLAKNINKNVDKAYNIGDKIAKGINKIDWSAPGRFLKKIPLADWINGVINYFKTINWGKIISAIPKFLEKINWGKVFDGMFRVLKDIGKWIWNVLKNIDWGGLAQALAKFIDGAFQNSGELLKALGKIIWEFLKSVARNIDWGQVATWMLGGFNMSSGKVGKVIEDIFQKADWNKVWDSALSGLKEWIGIPKNISIGAIIEQSLQMILDFFGFGKKGGGNKTLNVGASVLGTLQKIFDFFGFGKKGGANKTLNVGAIVLKTLQAIFNFFGAPTKTLNIGVALLESFRSLQRFLNSSFTIRIDAVLGGTLRALWNKLFGGGGGGGGSSRSSGARVVTNKGHREAPNFYTPGHFLASGGIVTKAISAVVGEAGAEAVIPLTNKSKVRPFAQAVASQINRNLGGGVVINQYITMHNTVREEADIKKIKRELEKYQRLEDREAGVLKFGYQI